MVTVYATYFTRKYVTLRKCNWAAASKTILLIVCNKDLTNASLEVTEEKIDSNMALEITALAFFLVFLTRILDLVYHYRHVYKQVKSLTSYPALLAYFLT